MPGVKSYEIAVNEDEASSHEEVQCDDEVDTGESDVVVYRA